MSRNDQLDGAWGVDHFSPAAGAHEKTAQAVILRYSEGSRLLFVPYFPLPAGEENEVKEVKEVKTRSFGVPQDDQFYNFAATC